MMASIWSTLLDISPLDWTGVLSACLAGGIIGLERQLQGKPAGIRTSMLICLGSYLFVAVSNGLVNGAGDPSRVVGQVITGIGFIGAGGHHEQGRYSAWGDVGLGDLGAGGYRCHHRAA